MLCVMYVVCVWYMKVFGGAYVYTVLFVCDFSSEVSFSFLSLTPKQ